jgi:regulator of RNase E activity RraA
MKKRCSALQTPYRVINCVLQLSKSRYLKRTFQVGDAEGLMIIPAAPADDIAEEAAEMTTYETLSPS